MTNPSKPDHDADAVQPAASIRTSLTAAGRRIDASIRTANLPVSRASTVLFDTLAQAEAAGQAVGRGERQASTTGPTARWRCAMRWPPSKAAVTPAGRR
jgi:cystathionine beta-lyase/cystathionine gamma-synthase